MLRFGILRLLMRVFLKEFNSCAGFKTAALVCHIRRRYLKLGLAPSKSVQLAGCFVVTRLMRNIRS